MDSGQPKPKNIDFFDDCYSFNRMYLDLLTARTKLTMHTCKLIDLLARWLAVHNWSHTYLGQLKTSCITWFIGCATSLWVTLSVGPSRRSVIISLKIPKIITLKCLDLEPSFLVCNFLFATHYQPKLCTSIPIEMIEEYLEGFNLFILQMHEVQK